MLDSSIKVPSTLVPVRGFLLLIPNAAIEEIIVLDSFEKHKTDPTWCIGNILWHGQSVDIISFESLKSHRPESTRQKNTIIILKNPELNSKTQFFALLANQTPSIIQADSQNIDKNLKPDAAHPYALSYVTIHEKPAIIPDLARIAKLIKKFY